MRRLPRTRLLFLVYAAAVILGMGWLSARGWTPFGPRLTRGPVGAAALRHK